MVKMRTYGKRTIGFVAVAFIGLMLTLAAGFPAGFAQIENVRVGQVGAGEVFSVNFQVHNTLNDRLRYVVVKAASSSNFMPVGGDTWSSNGEVERNSAVPGALSFRADDNLVAGVYSIPVTITSESKTLSGASFSGSVVNSLQTLSASDYFYVEVSGAPSLVLTQKSSVPGIIEAGRETLLSFELHNNGTDIARNVHVKIAEPEAVDISSASREIFIGELLPNGKSAFQVSFSPDKVPGRTGFVLPIEVSFDGGVLSEHEMVFLGKTADLEISGTSGKLVSGKNEQKLEVRIRNVGNSAAENVRLSLITDYPLTPSGRSSIIESLPPGEERVALFTVDVDSKGALQDYPVQIAASFEEQAQRKSEILEVRVSVVGGFPANYLFFGIAGVVLAIGLFFKFRRTKSKKGSETRK
ncbi:MAG: CARDB domain-containing protein [archaeon]